MRALYFVRLLREVFNGFHTARNFDKVPMLDR
jgi:hypothetical protein